MAGPRRSMIALAIAVATSIFGGSAAPSAHAAEAFQAVAGIEVWYSASWYDGRPIDLDVTSMPGGVLFKQKSNGPLTPWPSSSYGSPDCVSVNPGDAAKAAFCPSVSTSVVFIAMGPKADNVTIHGLNRLFYIWGNGGNDTIRDLDTNGAGTSSPGILVGGEGNDTLQGGPFDDVLNGGPGADKMTGGGGDRDMVDYNTDDFGVEQEVDQGIGLPSGVSFQWGPDVPELHQPSVVADIDNGLKDDGNSQDGTPGHRDTIDPSVEGIVGTSGNDTLTGSSADNILRGNGGDDVLNGGPGADRLAGGSGNDQENGEAGEDLLGDSALVGGQPTGGGAAFDVDGPINAKDSGADVLNGGDDVDTVFYDGHGMSNIVVSNDGTHGDGDTTDELPGTGIRDNVATSIENITTGVGADTLVGNAQANTLRGGKGKDILLGLAGNDKMYGDDGDDTILDEFYAGGGDDTIDGGQGIDTLSGQSGQDTILAKDPIPGAWVFWPDTIDCGTNPVDRPDQVKPNTVTFTDAFPDTVTGCETLLP